MPRNVRLSDNVTEDEEDVDLTEDDAKDVLDKARGKAGKDSKDEDESDKSGGKDDQDDDSTDEDQDDKTDWKAEATKWKKFSRKHEDDYKKTAAELKKHEDAKKSDLEREQEKASANEKRANDAERENKRLRIAAETAPENATPAQLLKIARRIAGDDDDALEEDAKELWADFGPAQSGTKKVIPGKPKEKLRGGGSSTDEDEEESDPRKLADMIGRRR